MYHLDVTVVEGKDIIRHGQLTNPYLKLIVGKQRKKTKAQKKTDQPIFEETLSFKIKDPQRDILRIKLKSKALLPFENALVGHESLRIRDIFADNSGEHEQWVEFRKTNPAFGTGRVLLRFGELHLITTIESTATVVTTYQEEDRQYETKKESSSSSSKGKCQSDVVELEIEED